jgi:hypothetical protein
LLQTIRHESKLPGSALSHLRAMREMTGKPFTGFVVMWDEVPRLMLADYSGDRARALIQVISNWLDMARALPRARAPLCFASSRCVILDGQGLSDECYQLVRWRLTFHLPKTKG